MFGLFESDEKKSTSDMEKYLSENKKISAELDTLVKQLGDSRINPEVPQENIDSYLNRLREEGRGI